MVLTEQTPLSNTRDATVETGNQLGDPSVSRTHLENLQSWLAVERIGNILRRPCSGLGCPWVANPDTTRISTYVWVIGGQIEHGPHFT